ncbi:MAG TPA: serine/threonine-protein kinase, partial [Polyangiaceae bacterium]|nr:serine/threonine-protein kinase [Polyangiaceae bacterium]
DRSDAHDATASGPEASAARQGGPGPQAPQGDGDPSLEGAPGDRPTRTERKVERASLRPGGPESLVGMTLSGRYLIERLIGEGGMGAVYQAEHTHMRKRLAVKVLHPEMSHLSEVVARFEREAMAAAHIDHPNVAAATDFGKLEDGSFFLVLEYVEGRSLRDAIAEGRLELGRALHIVRQIASALGRAHALGIVHRDLKPENVMLVTKEDDPDFVKVLDFGIAKVPVGELGGVSKQPGQVLTQLGMVYGTPEYMAPEQALGQPVDARADLYALGAMAFEMIAGVRPYEHVSKVTLLGMHVTAPIPRMNDRGPGSDVPEAIESIVHRLLEKEATARYADAKELIDVIDVAAMDLFAAGRIAEPASQPLSRAQNALPTSMRQRAVSGANSALALGPTGLAQPPVQLLGQPRGRLASLVGASLNQALKSAPPWMTPRRVTVAAAALGVLLLVVIFGAATSRSDSAAPGAPIASGGGDGQPAPKVVDTQTDELVAGAQTKIDKGDFATAIDTLAGVEKAGVEKAADRADVHQLLERAYTGVRNGKDAMREAGLWLAADPGAAADTKLEEDVRNAALFKDAQDDAFDLLESKMGPRGIDILYDIAFGNSGRQYPQAAARARHSLDSDDVRGRASAALAVLLDFRDAKTCDAKRGLLDRAGEHGDSRLLLILQPYLQTRGCGFLSRSDCYPCMHKDSALRDAMGAIEERAH